MLNYNIFPSSVACGIHLLYYLATGWPTTFIELFPINGDAEYDVLIGIISFDFVVVQIVF